jgi:hypothetical protein
MSTDADKIKSLEARVAVLDAACSAANRALSSQPPTAFATPWATNPSICCSKRTDRRPITMPKLVTNAVDQLPGTYLSAVPGIRAVSARLIPCSLLVTIATPDGRGSQEVCGGRVKLVHMPPADTSGMGCGWPRRRCSGWPLAC